MVADSDLNLQGENCRQQEASDHAWCSYCKGTCVVNWWNLRCFAWLVVYHQLMLPRPFGDQALHIHVRSTRYEMYRCLCQQLRRPQVTTISLRCPLSMHIHMHGTADTKAQLHSRAETVKHMTQRLLVPATFNVALGYGESSFQS
jgi:hypothetical protein